MIFRGVISDYFISKKENPKGPKYSGLFYKAKVVRGGSYDSSLSFSFTAYRGSTTYISLGLVGFRCVMDADKF
jgi:hypothetical protein